MAAKDEINVHAKGLLTQATVWDAQSRAIEAITVHAGNMLLVGVDAGIFADIVPVYDQVTTEVDTWTGQGAQVMEKITEALAGAAKRYHATEQEIIQATHGDVR